MNITVIELEHIMLEIARRYFGLSEDSHQHVINMDGLDYLEEAVKQGGFIYNTTLINISLSILTFA